MAMRRKRAEMRLMSMVSRNIDFKKMVGAALNLSHHNIDFSRKNYV
jgi:hypothetical protein